MLVNYLIESYHSIDNANTLFRYVAHSKVNWLEPF